MALHRHWLGCAGAKPEPNPNARSRNIWGEQGADRLVFVGLPTAIADLIGFYLRDACGYEVTVVGCRDTAGDLLWEAQLRGATPR